MLSSNKTTFHKTNNNTEEDDSILKRHFRDLRSKNADVRLVAARSIRQFLEQEARERTGDGFVKVMNNLQTRISEYGASLDMYEKLGCILLIDELVVLSVENESMVIRFMNQLSIIIKEQTNANGEMDVLGAATRALGHLAKSGAPGLTYDLLEHEITTALNWMRTPQQSSESPLPQSTTSMARHASMMIITELARNAPALFSTHVKQFFAGLWGVLTDQKIQVRVRAALALRSVLRLLAGSSNIGGNGAGGSGSDSAGAGNGGGAGGGVVGPGGGALTRQQSIQSGGLLDQQRKRPHDIVYAKAKAVFPPPGADWTNKKKKNQAPVATASSGSSLFLQTSSAMDKTDPFHASHRAARMLLLHVSEDNNQAAATTTYDFTNVALIHAALLTFYELLDSTYAVNSNMDLYFLEILQDCVWREEIRQHKDSLIVHHVIAILPRLANYCPNDMMAVYLANVVQYLLDIIHAAQGLHTAKANNDRAAAFRALGQLSSVPRVGKWFKPHVVPILQDIHRAISGSSSTTAGTKKASSAATTSSAQQQPICEEALECLEILVRCQDPYGLSTEAKDEVKGMVGAMFAGGLSEPLVQTLMTLGNAVPSLLPTFRQRLLQEITMVLGQAANPHGHQQQSDSAAARKKHSLFWTSAGDKLLVATNKALEQRLGLFASSADPYLVASLQGVMDGAPQHPSATAVAEATSLNLKNAFTIKKPSLLLGSSSTGVSTKEGGISLHNEMETYEQRLALKTLGTFDFRGVTLLPLVMAAVVQFLESPNVGVRYEAVIACCRLLSKNEHTTALPAAATMGIARTTAAHSDHTQQQTRMDDYRNASNYVVERLVVMAMTDPDNDIRCRVVEELDSRHFRELVLENPENLRSLFVLVNDHHFGVRAAAVVAIGHAAELAPSYVVPTMRTVLVRLLTELDFGGDLKHREESAALLGLLVQSLDPPLSRPHVDSMLKGLLPKLKDPNPAAAAAMMAALGEVATVARDSLLPHVGEILSVVIETLEERSTHHGNLEKEVALHTLSKVAKSTIMSIWPYFIRKKLLPLILQVLMSSSSPESVRRQAMIALGTLGALDPWLHKKIQASSGNEDEDFTMFSFEDRFSMVGAGGVYSFDEEDEFATELDDEFFGHEQQRGGSGHTTKKKHWLLSENKLTHAGDEEEEMGADLDVVYSYASTLPQQQAGDKRISFTSERRNSNKKDDSMMDVTGWIGRGGNSVSSKSRRGSVQIVQQSPQQQSTQGGGVPSPTNRLLHSTNSRRRSSAMYFDHHAQPQQQQVLASEADDSLPHGSQGQRVARDRGQQLRALASGARVAVGLNESGKEEEDAGVFGLDPSTILPSMVPGTYYSTVSITALVRVLNDQNALAHRQMAVAAILHIFDLLKSVSPYLPHVVPSLLRVAKSQLALVNATVRERTWPLEELGKLVALAKRDYRAYLPQTFELTRPYYGDAAVLREILNLAQTVATILEPKSLQLYVPNLLPEMLGILRSERESSTWVNSNAVLLTIESLGSALGDYLYLVLPMLMRLIEVEGILSTVRLDIRIRAVETLNTLIQKCDVSDYASRILHPLCKALMMCYAEPAFLATGVVGSPAHNRTQQQGELNSRNLFCSLLEVLTNVVFRLEEEFAVFVPMAEEALCNVITHSSLSQTSKPNVVYMTMNELDQIESFRSMCQRVLRGQALPKPVWYSAQLEDQAALLSTEDDDDDGEDVMVVGGKSTANAAKTEQSEPHGRSFSILNLKRVWETNQTSSDHWVEWMRRFSLELLKESPSPLLESCATLGQVHEPLVHDLFNAAFAALWGELSRKIPILDGFDKSLIASLNQAFRNPQLPKEILQSLLNLAEFMEHDDKPLPLDMRTLGELSLKTLAYAKSLHYKEIEFKMEPEQTVASLILINKNLDQVNAAIGVVEYCKTIRGGRDFDIQPAWYAQLGRWDEALDGYVTKLSKLVHTNAIISGLSLDEIEANTGRMECLKALGEWEALATLADEKRMEIRDMRRHAKRLAGKMVGDGTYDDLYLLGMQQGGGEDVLQVSNKNDKNSTSLSSYAAKLGGLSISGERLRPVSVLMKNSSSNRSATMNTRSRLDAVLLQQPAPQQQQDAEQLQQQPTSPTKASSAKNRVSRGGSYSEFHAAASSTDSLANMRFGNLLDHYDSENDIMSQYFQEISRLGAYANWMLRRWGPMETYVSGTGVHTYDGNFLRAVLDIHCRSLDSSEGHVEAAYRKLGQEVTANFGESYSRSYSRIVHVQELAEVTELICFLRLEQDGRREESKQEIVRLKLLWRQRLQGVQQNVDVLLPILAVRSMIVEPKEDIDTWLNFSKVARKQGRRLISLKALMNLGIGATLPESDEYSSSDEGGGGVLNYDSEASGEHRSSAPAGVGMANLIALHECDLHSKGERPFPLFPHLDVPSQEHVHPRVAFAYIAHLWTFGTTMEIQKEAVSRLKRLSNALQDSVTSVIGQGESPMEYVSVAPVEVVPSPPAAPAPENMTGTRRRSSGAAPAKGKSKLSQVVTSSFDHEQHESLLESLKKFPLEQRRRLAVRCNCELGEWITALNAPDSAELIANSNKRDSATVTLSRDLEMSNPHLQQVGRLRGMTAVPSFSRIVLPPNSPSYTAHKPSQDFQIYSDAVAESMVYYDRAIRLNSSSYRAWRLWALANATTVEMNEFRGVTNNPVPVVCAISGLFRSIDLGSEEPNVTVLQDILRLLKLWSKYGETDAAISHALKIGTNSIPPQTWLEVIPQLIARINSPNDLVCQLLKSIGRFNPQPLLFPLTVASNNNSNHDDDALDQRSIAAQKIIQYLQEMHPSLVEEARLVARELIRVAVLWSEMWLEGLEEASRLFFSHGGERNIDQMIACLEPLHEKIDLAGPETLSEVGFAHAFGRDLKEASEWLSAYIEEENLACLNQAWDLYYNVFKVISKQNVDTKSLELRHVSPQLLHASGLQLAVPGCYGLQGTELVRIEGFSPTLRVIRSKQRPRVITIHGSDGLDHMFLLKGHEDLRLDERVMQLLGLVNNLLAGDGETHRADVEIQKYAVIPLGARAGVMQWVPSCDTLHELIKEYREARKIPVNIEHRVIAEFAPQYESLVPIQKVEVFQHALRETSGQDLAKVLWLKSANSETWLDRRTAFTRSLAAMSIVGYVLGLGDRHPSNLMCERASGRVLHIDFGDCFEVAIHRDKFPESVPFRLTRQLVNAMEVSGVEGNYRITCENVMRVLRVNRESILTMLSAFVDDPLITWRLLKENPQQQQQQGRGQQQQQRKTNFSMLSGGSGGGEGTYIGSYVQPRGGGATTTLNSGAAAPGGDSNERAVEVIARVKAKLRGTDFDAKVQLDVKEQVDRLIKQAQSHENLATMYTGWSPVW